MKLDDVTIMRPFVEKPVDANDHNVWIYYPKNIVSVAVVGGLACRPLYAQEYGLNAPR